MAFNTQSFNLAGFNTSSIKNRIESSASITCLSAMSVMSLFHSKVYCSSIIKSKADIFARPLPTISNIADEPTRLVDAYIDIYFDGEGEIPVRFEYNKIDTLDLLEELKADSRRLLGSSSANELSVAVVNINRDFSPSNPDSPYSSKMKPGVLIKPWLTLGDAGGNIEYGFSLGTFYSNDWADNTDSTVISTTGYDRLYTLYNKPFAGTRIMKDISYYDLYQALFDGTEGIGSYVIDEALSSSYTTIGWLPTGKFRDALDFLAEASNTFCYVNRNNTIVVSRINTSLPISLRLNDINQIKSTRIPTSYNSAYSKLSVSVTNPKIDTAYNSGIEEIARISDYQVEQAEGSGETHTIENLAFLKSPVMKVTSVMLYAADEGGYLPSIISYSMSATHITIVISKSVLLDAKVSIVVYGQPVNLSADTVLAESETIKSMIGEKVYELKNTLIQNKEYAENISTQVFPIMINPHSNIELDIRGNPILQVGNTIQINDNTNKVVGQKVLVYRNKLSVAGGLSGEILGYNIT